MGFATKPKHNVAGSTIRGLVRNVTDKIPGVGLVRGVNKKRQKQNIDRVKATSTVAADSIAGVKVKKQKKRTRKIPSSGRKGSISGA